MHLNTLFLLNIYGNSCDFDITEDPRHQVL